MPMTPCWQALERPAMRAHVAHEMAQLPHSHNLKRRIDHVAPRLSGSSILIWVWLKIEELGLRRF